MSTEVKERAIGELYIRPATPVQDMNANELPSPFSSSALNISGKKQSVNTQQQLRNSKSNQTFTTAMPNAWNTSNQALRRTGEAPVQEKRDLERRAGGEYFVLTAEEVQEQRHAYIKK